MFGVLGAVTVTAANIAGVVFNHVTEVVIVPPPPMVVEGVLDQARLPDRATLMVVSVS